MFGQTRKLLPVLILAAGLGLGFAAVALSSADAPPAVREVDRPDAPAGPPLSARERVLVDIQEEGRAQVRALDLRMRTARDSEERLAIQREIAEVKTNTRVRFLEKLARQSLERGDRENYDEALRQIDLIRNPKPPSPGVLDPEAQRKLDRIREGRP